MNLSDTIASLAAARRGRASSPVREDRLKDLASFAPNPGNLRARLHIPAGLPAGAALVVVLHGCTQTAASYDVGAGWSTLADRHGFALLFPEQQRANNPNLCFNWFQPEDTMRGAGEVASIHAMIATVAADHAIDPARIFVTGLSAGGAMASALLATYPEVFAGGAIIAGLPYGVAANVSEALERMRGRGLPTGAKAAAAVRAASPHRGPWPTISVWHGDGDTTVAPANADAIVAQWRTLHGATKDADVETTADGVRRRGWHDAAGRIVIEEYRLAGMNHGTPLDMGEADPCGQAGAFMLDAGISSTRQIARTWGLLTAEAATNARVAHTARATPAAPPAGAASILPVLRSVRPKRMPGQPSPTADGTKKDVGKVIEDALRAAGLMR